MIDDNLTYFEKRILSELENLENRIKKLNAEKDALQIQLSKARADRTGLQNVTRKNSLNRVLAENSIIKALSNSKNALSSKDLFLSALYTNHNLNESTFRTYLHRMKKRNLIKTSRQYARHWVLPDHKE